MLYELSLFLIALIGSAIGGWIDLKTTEIPDIVPASMAALGLLVHIANAFYAGTWTNVYYSIAVGLAFLIFGYILYYTGQWGEADVLLLAAVGVVLPAPLSFFGSHEPGPFPLVFLLNTFVVGGLYSLAYSVVLAQKNRAVFPAFLKELKRGPTKKESMLLLLSILLYAALIQMLAYLAPEAISSLGTDMIIRIFVFLPALGFIYVFYKFARAIDDIAFRKKVASSELKEGDVLAEDVAGLKSRLYVGLGNEQIKKIREAKKEVWIKEGIRYGPTFFLAIVATWLWGNLLLRIISII